MLLRGGGRKENGWCGGEPAAGISPGMLRVNFQRPSVGRDCRGSRSFRAGRIIDCEFHGLSNGQTFKLTIRHRRMMKEDVGAIVPRDETKPLFLNQFLHCSHGHRRHSTTHVRKTSADKCVHPLFDPAAKPARFWLPTQHQFEFRNPRSGTPDSCRKCNPRTALTAPVSDAS